MDTSFVHYKPRRLGTSSFLPNSLPSVIALSPSGNHLAVGCSDGDVSIWKLPLGEKMVASHRVSINNVDVNGVQDVGVSSVAWASATLATFGRKNGLVTVAKLDYGGDKLSVMNFEADKSAQPVQYISHNIRLMLMAAVTGNSIGVWEWQEPQWNLWKKVRTFSAHNAPPISRVEENPVRITSLHWLRKYKGAKSPLLVSFLHHGVKVIDANTEQTIYTLPIRTDIGSLTLSDNETMIAANNTHNGFNLYDLPHGTPISHFVEHSLHPAATSGFFSFDRFLVHPGGTGVLKLWDVPSKFSLSSPQGYDQSRVLAVEARSFESYSNSPIFVTLSEDIQLAHTRYIIVWECFGETDVALMEMQRNRYLFSMVATCVGITGIVATWYLTSRGVDAFRVP